MTEIRQTHKNTVYSPLHGGTKTTSDATEGDGRVSVLLRCSVLTNFPSTFYCQKVKTHVSIISMIFATTLKLTFMRETEHLSV